MSNTITFAKLKKLSFCNSKDLPQCIKIKDGDKWIYKEWVGIGWIDVDPNEDAVEVTDD